MRRLLVVIELVGMYSKLSEHGSVV